MLERRANVVTRKVDDAGRRQPFASTQMVIDEKPRAKHEGGAQAGAIRQHETQRLHDMRRDPPQNFALDQRLVNQAEIEIFEIAQAAVDQLGGARRGAAGEIVHLAEMH